LRRFIVAFVVLPQINIVIAQQGLTDEIDLARGVRFDAQIASEFLVK